MPKSLARTPKTKPPTLSAGRAKLAALGIQLPLMPTTVVGSLPKTSDLAELRHKVSHGFVQPAELERKEKIATELWLKEQTRLGLQVFSDGEMQRSDLVSFFASKIDGFDAGGTVRVYGNRYYVKPIVRRKLAWKGPMSVGAWQFAQRATHSPVKAIVTGPYTMMDWTFNEYYSSRESEMEDLTAIFKKEVQALADAGAKIIQIDEPALPVQPNEFSLMSRALQSILAGIKSYTILHTCYTDISQLWTRMQKLPVDNLSIEAANSEFSELGVLKKEPSTKDISIGVIDVHSHVVESPKVVENRVRLAMKLVPATQLWISTDCGLKTRTAEEATGKMTHMAKAALKFRPRG